MGSIFCLGIIAEGFFYTRRSGNRITAVEDNKKTSTTRRRVVLVEERDKMGMGRNGYARLGKSQGMRSTLLNSLSSLNTRTTYSPRFRKEKLNSLIRL